MGRDGDVCYDVIELHAWLLGVPACGHMGRILQMRVAS